MNMEDFINTYFHTSGVQDQLDTFTYKQNLWTILDGEKDFKKVDHFRGEEDLFEI
jgi:hypothetical protein